MINDGKTMDVRIFGRGSGRLQYALDGALDLAAGASGPADRRFVRAEQFFLLRLRRRAATPATNHPAF